MRQFRCAGDIIVEDVTISPGQSCDVQLKQHSEICNFLQYLKPLTPQKPYFAAQIKALGKYPTNILILCK